MEKNTPYNVSNKNIKVKCFSHALNKVEMKKILSVIRKDDAFIYYLVDKNGNTLLKCSGNHRIWDEDRKKYIYVSDIESGKALDSSGNIVEFFVKETDEILPIVDIEVEDNSNYFTNNVLSHNTTAGGSALKFYASIRLKLTKLGTIEEGQGDNKQKTSVKTRVDCIKNKTFPPFRRAEYIVTFGKGIDNEALYMQTILENFVENPSSGNYILLNGEKIRGVQKVKAYLEENKEMFDRYKKMVDEHYGSKKSAEIPESEREEDSDEDENLEEDSGTISSKK